jgi:hypothetical protein
MGSTTLYQVENKISNEAPPQGRFMAIEAGKRIGPQQVIEDTECDYAAKTVQKLA